MADLFRVNIMTAVLSAASSLARDETMHNARTQILRACVGNHVLVLDNILARTAFERQTSKWAVLLAARDATGRNAVHYALIGQANDVLQYLVPPRALLFPEQYLRQLLLSQKTDHLETPIFYAIRLRCSPQTLDILIHHAGGARALGKVNLHGFGPLHLAALVDADTLVYHLTPKYNLDLNAAITVPDLQLRRDRMAPPPVPCQGTDLSCGDAGKPGDTPAHVAARHRGTAAFIVLHVLGADCTGQRNAAGESARDVADQVQEVGIQAYLEHVEREEEKKKKEEEAGEDDNMTLLSEIDEDQFDDWPGDVAGQQVEVEGEEGMDGGEVAGDDDHLSEIDEDQFDDIDGPGGVQEEDPVFWSEFW